MSTPYIRAQRRRPQSERAQRLTELFAAFLTGMVVGAVLAL
jgi:hypothetical protein